MPLSCPPRAPAPDHAASFAAALIDPAAETPTRVAGPRGKAAVRRYNVYRNNVMVSLIDALASIYPAVQRITGVAFFRSMARFHIRETPPTSPLLFEYGRDFPAFIETYDYAQEMPWLADTARIERAWLDAYHAADAEPLGFGVLSGMPSDRLAEVTFTPHPAMRIVRSPYAAATIFAANRGTEPVEAIDAGIAEDALIARPHLDVVVHRLPPGGATFLESLALGRPLGEAAAMALEASPDFDIGAGIAAMLDAGVFTVLHLEDAA